MSFQAVIFDADETVFNNHDIHLIVSRRILEDLKMPFEILNDFHLRWDYHYFSEQEKRMEEFGFCIDRENNGRSLQKALAEFNRELTEKEAEYYWKFMIEEYSEKSKPYKDALEIITYLDRKKIPMAIVSNGDTEIINKRLTKANIQHHFEFVIAPCNKFQLTKPDIKIFKHSLKKLNSSAEKTIYIGDNPKADIKGANNAGMFSVLIDRKNSFNDLEGLMKPDLKVSNLTEIKALFR